MSTKAKEKPRQRRADGELSRNRILDAAGEIAVERGYDGTSIGAVSAKCGLPASSIYWHFKDKDDLIAAVIERNYINWLSTWQKMKATDFSRESLATAAVRRAEIWRESPDFLRLGLMLALERRPVEPRARARFLQIRAQATDLIAQHFSQLVPGISDRQARLLAVYMVACTDGLFIANDIGGADVDIADLYAMNGEALYDTIMRMSAESADAR